MYNKREQKRKGEKWNKHNHANQSIIWPLKRHITQERKQLERLIYGLRTKLYLDLEQAIKVILEKISETEHSVELIAQEFNRRSNSDGKGR